MELSSVAIGTAVDFTLNNDFDNCNNVLATSQTNLVQTTIL